MFLQTFNIDLSSLSVREAHGAFHKRSWFTSVALNDFIYIIGGLRTENYVEKYSYLLFEIIFDSFINNIV